MYIGGYLMSASVKLACYLSGYLFVLGYLTSCAPVKGGVISKSGPVSGFISTTTTASSTQTANEVLDSIDVKSQTHVTIKPEETLKRESLPDVVEGSLTELDIKQLEELIEKGRTQVEIKNLSKRVEMHSLVVLNLESVSGTDRKKMKKFKLQWKVIDLQNFEVSVDGGLEQLDTNQYVLKNILSVGIGYQTL